MDWISTFWVFFSGESQQSVLLEFPLVIGDHRSLGASRNYVALRCSLCNVRWFVDLNNKRWNSIDINFIRRFIFKQTLVENLSFSILKPSHIKFISFLLCRIAIHLCWFIDGSAKWLHEYTCRVWSTFKSTIHKSKAQWTWARAHIVQSKDVNLNSNF